MSAVALRVRSDFRRRWRAWVGLALLIGLGAGAAMALAQGARRTRGAYPRFAEAQRAADTIVTGRSSFGLVGAVDLDRVESLPLVADSARAFVALPFVGELDDGRSVDASDLFPVAASDTRLGRDIERWKMLDGRRADPDRVDEAVASFELAERLGLRIGSTIDFRFYASATFTATAAQLVTSWPERLAERHTRAKFSAGADGPREQVRVVGIEASPAEFPPLITDLAPVLHLTPAFASAYRSTIVGSDLLYLRLAPGHGLEAFQVAVEELAAGEPVSLVATRDNQTMKVQRSIDVEANVLMIVAGLVALAAAIAVAQALARQTFAEREDRATLRSLGMNDRQLTVIVLLRALAIAVAGAVLAGAISVVLSPVAELRLARKADLHVGLHVDGVVLAIGTGVVFVIAAGVALWSTRSARLRVSYDRRAYRRGPGLTRPLTAGLGMRFALQRIDSPAWGAVLGVAASVAILVGAFTFVGNLDRQLEEPHRYGLNWDQKVGAPGLPDVSAILLPALRDDPDISALAAGSVTAVQIDGARSDVLAVDRVTGNALPTIVEGRAPGGTDEIALGARTARRVGVELGDSVTVTIGSAHREMRVVGQAVFPEFGDAGQLGTGALMTYTGLHELLPTALRNTFLLRYVPQSDAGDERELVARAVVPYPTRVDARPQDLVDLSRGDGLLGLLTVTVAILAFAVLLHALVTAMRRIRREFAVLRTLGLRRPQVWATVAWQVATLAVAAIIAGVPAGFAVGRLAWQRFATSLGVAADPVVIIGPAIAVALGLMVIAAIAALAPALMATRDQPAEALRAA